MKISSLGVLMVLLIQIWDAGAGDIESVLLELKRVTTDESILNAADRTGDLILGLQKERFKNDLTTTFLDAMNDLLRSPTSDEYQKRIKNIGDVAALGDHIYSWPELNKAMSSGKLNDALKKQLKLAVELFYTLEDIRKDPHKLVLMAVKQDVESFNRDNDGDKLYNRLKSTIEQSFEMIGSYCHNDTIQKAIESGRFDVQKVLALRKIDNIIRKIYITEIIDEFLNDVNNAINAYYENENDGEFNAKIEELERKNEKFKKAGNVSASSSSA